MARVAITLTELPYQGGVDATLIAADATNDHTMLNDGNTLLVVEATTLTTGTLTAVSVPDEYGRSDSSISAYSITDGNIYVAGPFLPSIWNQAGGVMHIDLGGTWTSANLIALHLVPRR